MYINRIEKDKYKEWRKGRPGSRVINPLAWRQPRHTFKRSHNRAPLRPPPSEHNFSSCKHLVVGHDYLCSSHKLWVVWTFTSKLIHLASDRIANTSSGGCGLWCLTTVDIIIGVSDILMSAHVRWMFPQLRKPVVKDLSVSETSSNSHFSR
jgi:hypothetical protein